ncbi:hypothetical protein NLX83_01785 [Allokutzneria sp. A3M-2-11 16]|uniref:hypothetical protein n=1 Tax=Allokutzneria sp. A3M-2-11 16 TaxID=2962043 RepID=UPI0020B83BE1|nr:hypothetical protein [Allokutzneria sp. A3M-2-11 16]MCP3797980.1 hypothetical protein [Allokutzneria sp. A3M-2-11 16]
MIPEDKDLFLALGRMNSKLQAFVVAMLEQQLLDAQVHHDLADELEGLAVQLRAHANRGVVVDGETPDEPAPAERRLLLAGRGEQVLPVHEHREPER